MQNFSGIFLNSFPSQCQKLLSAFLNSIKKRKITEKEHTCTKNMHSYRAKLFICYRIFCYGKITTKLQQKQEKHNCTGKTLSICACC